MNRFVIDNTPPKTHFFANVVSFEKPAAPERISAFRSGHGSWVWSNRSQIGTLRHARRQLFRKYFATHNPIRLFPEELKRTFKYCDMPSRFLEAESPEIITIVSGLKINVCAYMPYTL
jgi:hypothetical protein